MCEGERKNSFSSHLYDILVSITWYQNTRVLHFFFCRIFLAWFSFFPIICFTDVSSSPFIMTVECGCCPCVVAWWLAEPRTAALVNKMPLAIAMSRAVGCCSMNMCVVLLSFLRHLSLYNIANTKFIWLNVSTLNSISFVMFTLFYLEFCLSVSNGLGKSF